MGGSDYEFSPTPFVTVFVIGFTLGALGHLFKSKTMIAAGIALVYVAVLILPILYYDGR